MNTRAAAAVPGAVRSSCGNRVSSPQYGQYRTAGRLACPDEPLASDWRSCEHALSSARRHPLGEPLAVGRARPGSSGPPARRSRAARRAVTLWPRSLRPKPASRPRPPPRCTWKPSTWSPSWSGDELPLRPMSATWVRAQEFGQPLMLMVMRHVEVAEPASPARRPARAAWALVSTMASLQNSIPVQAIMFAPERRRPGRQPELARRRRPGASTRSGATSRTSSFCIGGGAQPVRAVRLGEVGELGQHACRTTRPTVGATARRRSGRPSARCTPTWSPGRSGVDRGRAVDQRALQVLVLQHLAELLQAPVGDQELEPGPVAQPAVAVVAEDADDARPDLGDLVAAAPRRRAAGPSIGLVDSPPPTQRSKPGPCSGCIDADERDVVDLVHHVLQRVSR